MRTRWSDSDGIEYLCAAVLFALIASVLMLAAVTC